MEWGSDKVRCLEGMNRVMATYVCRRLASDVSEWSRWWRWWNTAWSHGDQWAVAKRAAAPQLPHSDVSWLLLEFSISQKYQLHGNVLTLKKHLPGIMKHAVGQVWQLDWQSSHSGWSPQRLGQVLRSECWLCHILCYSEQLKLSEPQFLSNQTNGSTGIYLQVQDNYMLEHICQY